MARIESPAGVRLSESQARRTLPKLGLKHRKATSIPGKCDAQLQFDFYEQQIFIERLWKLTKKKRQTNCHYPAFAEFRAAIDCLRKMACDYLPELQSLLTLNFQMFPFHKSS